MIHYFNNFVRVKCVMPKFFLAKHSMVATFTHHKTFKVIEL